MGSQYLSPSILGLQMREKTILLKALCNLTGHARQIVCMQSGNFTKIVRNILRLKLSGCLCCGECILLSVVIFRLIFFQLLLRAFLDLKTLLRSYLIIWLHASIDAKAGGQPTFKKNLL